MPSANKARADEVTRKQFRSLRFNVTGRLQDNVRRISAFNYLWCFGNDSLLFGSFFLLRHTQSLPIQLICFSIDLRSPALSRVPPPERMAQKSCKQSKFSYRICEQPVDNEGFAAFLCLTFKLLGTHRAIPQPLLSTKPPEILSPASVSCIAVWTFCFELFVFLIGRFDAFVTKTVYLSGWLLECAIKTFKWRILWGV